MRYYLTIIIMCFAFMLGAAPVQAQDSLAAFQSRLNGLNQTQITLSPRYKTEQQMFDMRVIDGTRQLVGRVEDIRIDEGGLVAGLVSEINNVSRDESIVENEAFELSFHEDISAFEIPLGLDATQEVSAESLAAITPAAGGGHVYSLKSMIGADVLSHSGRRVGEVKHVVFDGAGEKIAALVLQDVSGAPRYRSIAVPFDPMLVEMRNDYGRIEFRMDRAAAKAVGDFARKNR